uniref:Helicase C-terminal domain-containing protein n=1 Tax=Piliocolobus tephrosceles TaxID=591936 RepID=A0A8C9GG79_9PRIM
MLLNYDFELDTFQKRSIKHLNNFKHVFVAAHTSAEIDNKLPVVLFCFSIARCEIYANSMVHLNFLDHKQKSKVHIFIKDAISKLSSEDKELNQIKCVSNMLEKGVGMHHSGLLPILKEIVEILFSKGLIKILFATETFAMGINMPTRSVVFTSIYKFDHAKKRMLTSSEYTQMSGRAGRRSSDKFGYVYIYCSDNIPDQIELTEMMMQKAVSLKSKFKVTYNMILKLLINKQINIEKMLCSSFLESYRTTQLP